MMRKNRQTLECGQIRVEFIARGELKKIPVTMFNTPRGVLRYFDAGSDGPGACWLP
jgi:hypothetical protein